jgi:hypothetical protein
MPPAPALLAVGDQVLRRGVPAERLRVVLDGSRGARGVRTARLVPPLANAKAGSPMESVLRWLIHEAGLPQPVLQHVVTESAGGKGVKSTWPGRNTA